MAMNNFIKNWKSAKTGIFRLEARTEYLVPEEKELFKKWQQDNLDLGGNKESQHWMESLKKAAEKGITVQHLRVIPKTLPEYIKFEIGMWQKYSTKNGEQFFFLAEDEYQNIIKTARFNAKDFWLFDDTNLLIMNYTKTGQFSGDILITDGSMVQRYVNLKQKLLEKAVPLATFAKTLA